MLTYTLNGILDRRSFFMARKKKKDSKEVFGRIITIIFILLLAAVVWFLVNLFKEKEISASNLSGQWKLAGSPVVYYTFTGEDDDKVLNDIDAALEAKKEENAKKLAKNKDLKLEDSVVLGEGTMTSYTKTTGTNITSDVKEYDYVIKVSEIDNAGTLQKVYKIEFTNTKDDKDKMEWKINAVSRAQMTVTMNRSEITSLTRVDVF